MCLGPCDFHWHFLRVRAALGCRSGCAPIKTINVCLGMLEVKDGSDGPRFLVCLRILRFLLTWGFILLTLQQFPGNDLDRVKFQTLYHVRTYFKVVFKGIWVSRGSELDETTLILGNGHFGVTTAQHQELTLLYIDVFYISLWGSLEWCTRCLSNSLRMERQTCAVPVSSQLVTGQSNIPWALHSDNGEFSCKRSWWERMGQENV